MARCFPPRHASPAGKARMASSTARSCVTSRCASAKPRVSAIWRNMIHSPGSPIATRYMWACLPWSLRRRNLQARWRCWCWAWTASSTSTTCWATPATAAQFAERIARAFDRPLAAGAREHRVKVSIGVAVYPEAGSTADELLSNGHLAFSRAKATRRGGHVMFESAIRHELEGRLTLEAEIALAVERQEFELFYQPQVHLVDGSLIGAEALIRWRHPERGLVSPGLFMPVVNSSSIS